MSKKVNEIYLKYYWHISEKMVKFSRTKGWCDVVTEEQKSKKLFCFYDSEYHLEMILLPYIKNNLKNSNFTIFTQKDLSKSINLLLERINLKKEEKEQIKNLNWKKKNNIEKDIKKNIIINGDLKYI